MKARHLNYGPCEILALYRDNATIATKNGTAFVPRNSLLVLASNNRETVRVTENWPQNAEMFLEPIH